jgi:hypothetical protein
MAGDEVAPAPSVRLPPQPTNLDPRAGKPTSWGGMAIAAACVITGAAVMGGIAWRASQLGSARRASTDPGARPSSTVPATNLAPALEPTAAMPPLEMSVPPLSKISPSAAGPKGGAVATGAARVLVDMSNPKPGIGQPVDFVARIAGPKPARLEGARFVIAGPGIASGTELPASDEGSGVFRTTFTFLEGGRFQVDFNARADGAPVRGNRVVVIGEAAASAPAPAAPPVQAAPPPAPAPSPATPSNASAGTGPNAQWL